MKGRYIVVIGFFITSFLALYSQANSDFMGLFSKSADVKPVNNKTYASECSDCHFAYQPGLLPKRSWQKIMSKKALEDHFGDNAELEEQTRIEILNYLTNNSADNASFKRSRKIMRSLRNNDTPMRISKTSYIVRKHDEISQRLITQKEVGSLSNCQACHKTAENGIFDDDNVTIPNYSGRSGDDD